MLIIFTIVYKIVLKTCVHLTKTYNYTYLFLGISDLVTFSIHLEMTTVNRVIAISTFCNHVIQ